jgi:MFS transporter, YQGE family, putative transporter
MISRIFSRLRIERSHFQLLSEDARRMIVSFTLFLAAYPLIATFMNAYLWRSSGNLWSIVIYNMGYVIGIPCGFYLNGFLLQKFHVLRLYLLGALLQAITPCLVIFFPFSGIAGLIIYGLFYGFGAGLFWGNKNYLDLQITRGTNRMYYNSIGQIFNLGMNIIVPACAGWFIVFLASGRIDPTFTAYKIIMIIAFLLLCMSGLVIQFSSIKQITIRGVFIKKPKIIWQHMRLFSILFNLQIGATLVVPNILILKLVGHEGVLGTIQAITASISAVALYIIGRKSTTRYASRLIFFGSMVFLAGTAALAGMYTWAGALIYSTVITISWASQWTPICSVAMDLMDTLEPDTEKQYAYICDNELFYNIGRVAGISIVSVLAILASETSALRFSPLLVGLLQLPLAWLIREIVHRLPTPSSAATSAATGEAAAA